MESGVKTNTKKRARGRITLDLRNISSLSKDESRTSDSNCSIRRLFTWAECSLCCSFSFSITSAIHLECIEATLCKKYTPPPPYARLLFICSILGDKTLFVNQECVKNSISMWMWTIHYRKVVCGCILNHFLKNIISSIVLIFLLPQWNYTGIVNPHSFKSLPR